MPRSSTLSTMPHQSPTYHETSKCVSPHKTYSRLKPLKFPRFKFKPRQVNYSSQIKPRYWPLGFSISPLMSTLTTQRHRVWISNPRPHEAQLEDQKSKKVQEGHLEEGKNVKPTNDKKSSKSKKKQRKTQTQNSPLTLLMQALPLGRIYHVCSLNHQVSKRVLPTLCIFSPPLAMNSSNTNREKHEMLCMRSKLGCFTRHTSRYLNNCTQPLCQDLQTQELIFTKGPLIDNKHVARS
jgi:hypothetical protein